MYKSFDEVTHALLSGDELEGWNGAEVYRQDGQWYYVAPGASEDKGGEFMFAIVPSVEAGERWKFWPGANPEAQALWDAFRADPRNGELIPKPR